MAQVRDKFIKGCESNGIHAKIAIEVWQMIDHFGGYGFNKSHSLAYAFIAYQTAYLKRYFPLEFFSSLLTSVMGDDEKTNQYINEAKSLGVTLYQIHINRSRSDYYIDERGLRCPFNVVSGVGEKAVAAILEKRKEGQFESFENFVERVGGSINKNVVHALANSNSGNAFSVFGVNPTDAVNIFQRIKADLSSRKIQYDKFTRDSLFDVGLVGFNKDGSKKISESI